MDSIPIGFTSLQSRAPGNQQVGDATTREEKETKRGTLLSAGRTLINLDTML